ncbi:MAG: hypothetical protein CMC05_01640 [Flavobacteriaceae bacterium]|nr:hypothetical protein [Flavobacteriaceae bacterium]|tara:strand:+ start:523 stop:1137 length:615 start_codon:yes stop_codon:yes gene_type:complete
MRSKLHFGIIIVLLAFLGRFIETPATPNQEITIQFSNANVSEIEVQNALQDIQQKLQKIGAESLLIGQDKNGNLKIAYYSVADVQSIEHILTNSSDFNFLLGESSFPSNKNSDKETLRDYKLNVSEIQKKNQNNDWDFDGVQIVELNQKTDRFNNLKKDASGSLYQLEVLHQLVKVGFRINSGTFILENRNLYEIPEVRAGPIS